MSLAELSLRRPVATAVAYVAIGLLGVVSFVRLPIDLLPDVAFPTLSVWTGYPDAGPAQVERFVTEPVERAVSRVPGVRRVASRSREGQSLVRLEFYWGTEMEFAALHVRERLDNLVDVLPESAERPVILSADPTAEPVLALAVAGDDLVALRGMGEAVFKRRLEQLEGVALAAVTGGLEREIRIEVDPRRLEAQEVTVAQVAQALDDANYSAPGGEIRRGRFRYSLRTLGEFGSLRDIESVVVARRPEGGVVRVRDVARVFEGSADRQTIARWDGEEAIGILVYKEAGSNTVRVADRVGEVLEELRAEFPEVRIELAASQAGFIRDAIASVVQALLLGGVLAFLVLFLFLRDPRYPVAVGLAIPVSVLAAFSLLYLADVSLNVMSLGGLALGVGMLVDNSIVVLENVFRHRQVGRGARESAALGAREVAGAIAAATFTTIAVFGPVLYVEGAAGALFADLSLAVAFSLLASLLVAVSALPVLAARFGEGRQRETDGATARTAGRAAGAPARLADRAWGPLLRGFDRAYTRLIVGYEAALTWCLAHRPAVLGLSAVALAAAAAVGLTLPRALMPDVDERAFRVELALPVGTPLEATARQAALLEEILRGAEGVEAVFTRVGRAREAELATRDLSGLNSAALEVRLAPEAPPAAEVAEGLRRALPGIGVDPAAVTVELGQATSLGRALGLGEADVAVRVKGRDLEALLAVAESAAARLADVPLLADVRLDVQRTQPELRVEVDREAAARHGFTVSEVADAVEGYLRGEATGRPYTEFAAKVEIRVVPPEEARRHLSDVLALPHRGVPIAELVRAEEGYGPVEIRRAAQSRMVQVLADVRHSGLAAAVAAAAEALEGMPRPPLVGVEVGGENEEMRESFRSLRFAFGLALFLVFLIMAAKFESFTQPLVVLVSVPLALAGALPALALTGGGLNAMSGIGLVILIGIAVNDAIVKVDFINQRRAEGAGKREAILEAGRLRLRPIVMTSVTTVFGLLPMALGWGAGADLRAPLAVAVIGGLVSSTLLTLLVVPVAYSLLVAPGEPVVRPVAEAAPGSEAAVEGTLRQAPTFRR